jgi:hypothetical protein
MLIELTDTLTPKEVALKLIAERDPGFVRKVVIQLDEVLKRTPLEKLRELWGITDAEAARMFGVSRQAYAKWLENAPPADRAPAIAALDDATELLERHLKRERIAAVVRRPSALTNGLTLIQMAEQGKYDELLAAVQAMFDIRRIQP